MKLFLDSASMLSIDRWGRTGLVAGLTTNPAILERDAPDTSIVELVRATLGLLPEVSVQIPALRPDGAWLDRLLELGDGVAIKVPLDRVALAACDSLELPLDRVNVTAITTRVQAIAAAALKPRFLSVFWNRAKDDGVNPTHVVYAARDAIERHGAKTRIIVGSIRRAEDVLEAFQAGADVATVGPKILEELLASPATEKILGEWYGERSAP